MSLLVSGARPQRRLLPSAGLPEDGNRADQGVGRSTLAVEAAFELSNSGCGKLLSATDLCGDAAQANFEPALLQRGLWLRKCGPRWLFQT
jgi:hypothetical protein